eukprot:scaffold337464_cov31-Prasinocladus_malaysianus.AAC.1
MGLSAMSGSKFGRAIKLCSIGGKYCANCSNDRHRLISSGFNHVVLVDSDEEDEELQEALRLSQQESTMPSCPNSNSHGGGSVKYGDFGQGWWMSAGFEAAATEGLNEPSTSDVPRPNSALPGNKPVDHPSPSHQLWQPQSAAALQVIIPLLHLLTII